MRISLFIPCFVDALYPKAAISVVKVLERLGHSVEYPMESTCCGQPAFNCGYWPEARRVATSVLNSYRDAEVVVAPSGSCSAMIKVFYQEIFKDTSRSEEASVLADKTWEFSDFLVTKLNITDVGAKFDARVTLHDGCHGLRELGIDAQPRQLLQNVRGVELVEMTEARTCCGFGGVFSTKYSTISTAMGQVKCESALTTGADYIVSNDSSCLMHIQGLLDRGGKPLRSIHLAEVLASQ